MEIKDAVETAMIKSTTGGKYDSNFTYYDGSM